MPNTNTLINVCATLAMILIAPGAPTVNIGFRDASQSLEPCYLVVVYKVQFH